MTRQCMSCGHRGMVRNEDCQEKLSFDGESVTLTDLTGWFCPSCGEGELDPESSRRYGGGLGKKHALTSFFFCFHLLSPMLLIVHSCQQEACS
ncbi:MAG: YgiT-type zinc finger protein [Acidithiobacillus sp.]